MSSSIRLRESLTCGGRAGRAVDRTGPRRHEGPREGALVIGKPAVSGRVSGSG
jgi:hypothetical protein